jgi:hypothetical protein
MINRELRYIVLSDIHLGHRNNKTNRIIEQLDAFFDHYKPRSDGLNLIIIAGDLFDTLLDMSGPQVHEILVWISRLMRYCALNQIKLRILEGTPSHDWMQSEMFQTVGAISRYEQLDYKYIKTLSIEIIEEYNLSILYVPDEWHPDTAVTLSEVKTLLEQYKCAQVDIAIMHGQFTYQLPAAAHKAPRHDEAAYLGLVRHFINIGHVHQFSTYERILAQGSFDRLCHGDEIPKGALYEIIRPDGHDEYFFLENKAAMVFKTLSLSEKAWEDIPHYLDARIEKYPPGSFIRLKTKHKEKLSAIFEALIQRYPHYTLSKDTRHADQTTEQIVQTEMDMTTYTPIVITPENIESLLMQQIKLKYPPNQYNESLCSALLQGVL